MQTTQYVINDKTYSINITGSSSFLFGKNQILSNAKTDITHGQDWYDVGYKSANILDSKELEELRAGLSKCIIKILSSTTANLENFELSKYHEYAKTDEEHNRVTSITRDLFPEDFNFPIEKMYERLGNLLGFELSDNIPGTDKKLHIIIRINRPGSSDYNPPHKDIYEVFDSRSEIPQFVNFWIPICGVTEKSSLPMVPYSHLIPESKILRTIKGGTVEGKNYRVRSIKEWDGNNKMLRAHVLYGETLVFSPHIIHGLAINEEDQTRVSLEFRLFKKN